MPDDRIPDDSIGKGAYMGARIALTGLFLFMFVAGVVRPDPGARAALFWVSVCVLAVAGVATSAASRRGESLYRRVIWAAFPFDVAALSVLVYALHDKGDPLYPLLLGLALFYAAMAPPRWGWAAVSVTVALFHVGAHLLAPEPDSPSTFALLLVGSGMMVFFAFVVSTSLRRQLAREHEVRRAHEEVERLNEHMERRLTELHAVSEISEMIHSSLDFDSIGPVVIDIIQKVIDIPAASLFVIDKARAETLFSASGATQSPMYSPTSGVAQILEGEDVHFSCLSVLDRDNVMVVFCAASAALEAIRPEDKLVLQTIAGELVVAVENSRLYKLTKRMSVTDELTGLYNYRYLQQRLDEEVERARRYEKSLSLLMLDVDDFKRYNDTHGHIAGDRALSALGRVVHSCVREVDVVARYGGEEFSVLLPETDEPGAYVAAEKVREAIGRYRFIEADSDPTHLTVSIGVASMPGHASDKEGLLQQADEALYQAKSFGKNRVRTPRKGSFQDAGEVAGEAV
ncbi:MAG: GGDEF domain-containing protein [Coriobacteriia bacterium]|nr:GGDEF domain-containing protein [Coriobacteriia bacterium]